MLVRWLLAAFHLLALGLGLGAIWARAHWLRSSSDPRHLRYALAADTWWGLAALLWIGTGLWRMLAAAFVARGRECNHRRPVGQSDPLSSTARTALRSTSLVNGLARNVVPAGSGSPGITAGSS